MEISEIREQINAVDDQLLQLFLQRMTLSEEVAAYKNEHHQPILNKQREREILAKVAERSGDQRALCLPSVLHAVRAVPLPPGGADLLAHPGEGPGGRLSGCRQRGVSPDGPCGLPGSGGGKLPGGLRPHPAPGQHRLCQELRGGVFRCGIRPLQVRRGAH